MSGRVLGTISSTLREGAMAVWVEETAVVMVEGMVEGMVEAEVAVE
jgi:hypothetical protein